MLTKKQKMEIMFVLYSKEKHKFRHCRKQKASVHVTIRDLCMDKQQGAREALCDNEVDWQAVGVGGHRVYIGECMESFDDIAQGTVCWVTSLIMHKMNFSYCRCACELLPGYRVHGRCWLNQIATGKWEYPAFVIVLKMCLFWRICDAVVQHQC